MGFCCDADEHNTNFFFFSNLIQKYYFKILLNPLHPNDPRTRRSMSSVNLLNGPQTAPQKFIEVWRILFFTPIACGDRSSTVVKVRCHKSEGRWFDSRWCHWNFLLTYSFRSRYDLGVDSASNRNEYQEYFLGVKAAGA